MNANCVFQRLNNRVLFVSGFVGRIIDYVPLYFRSWFANDINNAIGLMVEICCIGAILCHTLGLGLKYET